jgi:hypothetical protein
MTIHINNKRIIDFCTKHPSFDIEKTVLSFIDFVEETYTSANPSLDSNLASQILTNLKTLQQQVQGIDSTISIKQNEYINKSMEIKKEYIDDVKNILMLNNNEKIVPIIKEYNETFINKLSLLFKDLIPKEQQAQTMYLQTVLKNIEQNVAMEMNKGVNQESIDRMLGVIDQKFASILTHSEQKITNVLSTLSQNKQDDNILHMKLDNMLDKLGKTTDKGKISENMLEFNLQSIYPTAEIRNVVNTPHSGDFWLIRKDKPTIIVENKNYKETVYGETVQKFIDDMNEHNLCGIMISQNSKIVHKNNFEIEIHNGNVAVYIHECNYDPNKIKIAVRIIDTFKSKIEKNKNDNATIHIDKDILEKINKEFQLFNNKKRQHIAEIKNMYDTLTKSAEDMEMESLDELLESQGLLTNVKKYVCGKCPRTFKTQKGLDTHERICSQNKDSKALTCELCNETAKTFKGLKSHYRNKHKIELKDDTCLDCCSETSSNN